MEEVESDEAVGAESLSLQLLGYGEGEEAVLTEAGHPLVR